MLDKTFYLEELNLEVSSYELKMFRSQHDETQLEAYLKKYARQVACKAMFVFAIDTPKLIKYYKETLRFKEISDTDEKQFFEYAAPDYDEGCRFLYYSL